MEILRSQIHKSTYNNQFSKELIKAETHFNNLYKACGNKFLKNCGSYLIEGSTYAYYIDHYPKQKFLYDLISKRKNINILEIGTHMGHSLLLMLMANNQLSATCIDIDDTYSRPAIEYLKKSFPNANIEFIKGDSLKVFKNIKKKYELFLIDGTHRNTQVTREFTYIINNLLNSKKIDFILDDINHAKPLKNNIFSSFFISEEKLIDVPGGNIFFQIIFPQNIFKLFLKKQKFYILNLKWYLKKKLFKLINFQKI